MNIDETVLSGFQKEDSLMLKGVAILMMLWHHCFLAGRFEAYSVIFWPLKESQVVNIAEFFKICVSLFAFISGYGLFLTWRKTKGDGKSTSRWVYEKLVKTRSNYWFVLALAWIVSSLLDNRPYRVYGFEQSAFLGIWNMLIDFLGLTNLTGGEPLNSTWWYMSAAVVFIVLLPLICRGFEAIGSFCTLSVILILPRTFMGFPGGVHFFSFLPIFAIGIVCAKCDFFTRWNRLWSSNPGIVRVLKLFIMLSCLLVIYKISYHLNETLWWDVKWNLFPIAFILFFKDYVFKIPIINQILIFIGKHATNIFLVHTFVRYYYCEAITYSIGGGNFLLIMVMLFLVSLVFSIIIEALKKASHYDILIQKLLCVGEKRADFSIK